jgi:hypothetical protein
MSNLCSYGQLGLVSVFLFIQNLNTGCRSIERWSFEESQIQSNDGIRTEGKTNGRRPWIVTLVAVMVFAVGSIGLLSAIIASAGALFSHVDLASFYVAAIFWCLVGPLLILAGYNLWKRKKWAAQVAGLIVVFDLASPLIPGLLSPSPNIDIGVVSAWILDIATLILIFAAWKHLQ